MASEIRVNKIINRSGLSTVTFSDTGAIVSGIITANNFSGNVTGDVTGSGANLTNLPAGQLTGALPAISGANLTSIPAGQLTGTIADARISSSSVTQHVTPFNDDAITNDISILALKVSALENSAASNTNSTYVDTFQDSAGVSNFTTSGRSNSGEYISSVYDAITNITAGWHGGGTNTTGDVNPAAGSYQGIDGVTRSYGQIVGNGNFPGYNGYCFGYVFPASTNFELIFKMRGSWHAGGRIHGSGLPSTISSSIGTFRTEPPSSLSTTFTSHTSNISMSGGYPLPDGSNGGTNRTLFYRYFRDNGSVTCTYTES